MGGVRVTPAANPRFIYLPASLPRPEALKDDRRKGEKGRCSQGCFAARLAGVTRIDSTYSPGSLTRTRVACRRLHVLRHHKALRQVTRRPRYVALACLDIGHVREEAHPQIQPAVVPRHQGEEGTFSSLCLSVFVSVSVWSPCVIYHCHVHTVQRSISLPFCLSLLFVHARVCGLSLSRACTYCTSLGPFRPPLRLHLATSSQPQPPRAIGR